MEHRGNHVGVHIIDAIKLQNSTIRYERCENRMTAGEKFTRLCGAGVGKFCVQVEPMWKDKGG